MGNRETAREQLSQVHSAPSDPVCRLKGECRRKEEEVGGTGSWWDLEAHGGGLSELWWWGSFEEARESPEISTMWRPILPQCKYINKEISKHGCRKESAEKPEDGHVHPREAALSQAHSALTVQSELDPSCQVQRLLRDQRSLEAER